MASLRERFSPLMLDVLALHNVLALLDVDLAGVLVSTAPDDTADGTLKLVLLWGQLQLVVGRIHPDQVAEFVVQWPEACAAWNQTGRDQDPEHIAIYQEYIRDIPRVQLVDAVLRERMRQEAADLDG